MKPPAADPEQRPFRTREGPVGDLPWCAVFNTESYFRIHLGERSLFFSLTDRNGVDVRAVVHFTEVAPGLFRSPARGTYAGIDVRGGDFEPLAGFLDDVESRLAAEGAQRITISEAPYAHDPAKAAWMRDHLASRGYAVELHQLNYSVPIDEVDLVEKMRANNRKRFRKCAREGFVFARQDGNAHEVYDVIARNRAHRGYPISMTFEEVLRMVETFPGAVSFYGVHRGEQLVASAVCLRLSARVLYTVYWGDVPGWARHSPVVFLAAGIYGAAREMGFELMDTGTVPGLPGGPSDGLIRFKEGLGCRATSKLTYTKVL